MNKKPFVLTPVQVAALRPGVDVRLLEKLLGQLPAEAHPIILRSVSLARQAGYQSTISGSWQGIELEDAQLQSIYNEAVEGISSNLRTLNREQIHSAARRAPVLLVLPPEWRHENEVTWLERRPGPPPSDLVFVHASAEAPALYRALEDLVEERIESGIEPTRELARGPNGDYEMPASPPLAEFFAEVIERLKKAEEHEVSGEGPCRTLEFRLIRY